MSHSLVTTKVALNHNWEWGPDYGISWGQRNNSHILLVCSKRNYWNLDWSLVLVVHNHLGVHLHLGLLLIHLGLLLIHLGLLNVRLGLLVYTFHLRLHLVLYWHLRLLKKGFLSCRVSFNDNFLTHNRLLSEIIIVDVHFYY